MQSGDSQSKEIVLEVGEVANVLSRSKRTYLPGRNPLCQPLRENSVSDRATPIGVSVEEDSMSKVRKPRVKRSAAEVAASQNQLILRKLVQEGAIPEHDMVILVQKYLSTQSQEQ